MADRAFGGALVGGASLLGLVSVVGVAKESGWAPEPSPAAPRVGALDSVSAGYAGGAACGACHPGEHATFSRTAHRTMTQRANDRTVLAPDEELRGGEGSFALFRRGGEAWVRTPSGERRLVLVTGSRDEQIYWFEGDRRRELRAFPWVYAIRERGYIPRSAAFVQPVGAGANVRWNSNCIACHTTAGEPGHDLPRDVFRSSVVDLGISCEACHGPGARHIEAHAGPLDRLLARRRGAPHRSDPTIVNPSRLAADRSAALCGQCHAYAMPRDEDAFWNTGYVGAFKPGDLLEPSRVRLKDALDPRSAAWNTVRIDASASSLFWADGTMRVGGREYDGMVESACFKRGIADGGTERRITCISCHEMHAAKGAPPVGRTADAACESCHVDVAANRGRHTHHAPASEGASCVGCHMPKTSYALFRATRSHRIEIPDPDGARVTGRLPACNGCHVDRSLAWTARTLSGWKGRAVAAEPDDEPSAFVLALTTGDAASRAIMASNAGDLGALATGAAAWEAPYVAILLDDPIPAVRIVAARTLARIVPGVELSPLGDAAARAAQADEIATRTKEGVSRFAASHPGREGALLLGPGGAFDPGALLPWVARRDDRPVTIAE